MAFSGLTFPTLKLKHGITKEMVDPISITGNGAREVRRKQNKTDRGVWSFPARAMSENDKQALVKFLQQTKMGLDSFYFQDPTYPEFNNAIMPNRSSATFWCKLPYDATTAGIHPIIRPVIAGLTFKKDGVPVVGVTWSTDSSNGQAYFNVPGANAGSIITVTGPCYFVARFAGTVSYTIAAMERSSLGGDCNVVPTAVQMNDFQIVEVFE